MVSSIIRSYRALCSFETDVLSWLCVVQKVPLRDSLAERSKARDSSSRGAIRVGSNPTAVMFFNIIAVQVPAKNKKMIQPFPRDNRILSFRDVARLIERRCWHARGTGPSLFILCAVVYYVGLCRGTRGLVVEYNVAIVVTRVRFPAGASLLLYYNTLSRFSSILASPRRILLQCWVTTFWYHYT